MKLFARKRATKQLGNQLNLVLTQNRDRDGLQAQSRRRSTYIGLGLYESMTYNIRAKETVSEC